ncbi:unnamed protein product [Amaranthus hypochondriacus]
MDSIASKICCNYFGLCGSTTNEEDDSFHANGNVQHIMTIEAWEETLKLNNKVIIACFKASWCGPCKIMEPFYGDLSRKYASLLFVSIDIDDVPDLSESFDIQATPTFFFFLDRQEIDKLVGSNKVDLQKKIVSASGLQGRGGN